VDAASWGPSCSIAPRSRCTTRIAAEQSGEAERHAWYGFMYPVHRDWAGRVVLHQTTYSWTSCPFCGGSIRAGLRSEILGAPNLNGEGDE